MLHTPLAPSRTYALGHSDRELARLMEQSRYFDELTRPLLRQAGVREGLHVLDVGCGAGDVSLLLADLVGPDGVVIGIDKSPAAIAHATRRAASVGLGNVQFHAQDAVDLVLDSPVDAVVGRLILMYFTDPAVVLRRLTSFVRPGGIVIFQEMDMHGATSVPTCPAFETAVERIRQTFARAGIDDRTALRLPRIFREAGLPAPRMVAGSRVEAGPEARIYAQVAAISHTLRPLMLAQRIAPADEMEHEPLADRLRTEAVALDATILSPTLVGAWSRIPAADPGPF